MTQLIIGSIVAVSFFGLGWYIKGRGMAGVQIDINNIKTDVLNLKNKIDPSAPAPVSGGLRRRSGLPGVDAARPGRGGCRAQRDHGAATSSRSSRSDRRASARRGAAVRGAAATAERDVDADRSALLAGEA